MTNALPRVVLYTFSSTQPSCHEKKPTKNRPKPSKQPCCIVQANEKEKKRTIKI